MHELEMVNNAYYNPPHYSVSRPTYCAAILSQKLFDFAGAVALGLDILN